MQEALLAGSAFCVFDFYLCNRLIYNALQKRPDCAPFDAQTHCERRPNVMRLGVFQKTIQATCHNGRICPRPFLHILCLLFHSLHMDVWLFLHAE